MEENNTKSGFRKRAYNLKPSKKGCTSFLRSNALTIATFFGVIAGVILGVILRGSKEPEAEKTSPSLSANQPEWKASVAEQHFCVDGRRVPKRNSRGKEEEVIQRGRCDAPLKKNLPYDSFSFIP